MTQKSSIPPAFPQQLPRSQAEWQNFLNQLQQALLSPTSAAYKASTTSLSTATLTADPDLNVIVPAAGIYSFEAALYFNTSGATGNTPGVALEVAFSGTLDSTSGNAYSIVGFADASTSTVNAINIGTTFALFSGSLPITNGLTLKGSIQCKSAGTLGIEWAQQNASASAVTLAAGSYLSITRLN